MIRRLVRIMICGKNEKVKRKFCFTGNTILAQSNIKSASQMFSARRFCLYNVQNVLIVTRTFHTSKPKTARSPFVWIIIRAFLQVFAVVSGIAFRRWWRALPQVRREILRSRLRKNKGKILLGGILSYVTVSVYYVSNVVVDPITQRKKFLLFSEKQIIQLAEFEYERFSNLFSKRLIKSGQEYDRVFNITKRILSANKHLPVTTDRRWHVLIVDTTDKNAFVLPSGHIFIFKGMMEFVDNDDQLAIVLAHEMAHAILGHGAETISRTHILELLMILPIFAVWASLPQPLALFCHVLTELICGIFFKLPYSRTLEIEADTVGLEMAAHACYDPRQAIVFWKKMEKLGKQGQIQWLSTHPSYSTRYKTLDSLMAKAFKILITDCMGSDWHSRAQKNYQPTKDNYGQAND